MPLISSDFSPEETCMESAHAWVLVVMLGELRGSSFVFTNISLLMFTVDTLKLSHASTNIEFM